MHDAFKYLRSDSQKIYRRYQFLIALGHRSDRFVKTIFVFFILESQVTIEIQEYCFYPLVERIVQISVQYRFYQFSRCHLTLGYLL